MNELLVEAMTQWGMTGVALIAAGYIIWNTHKSEKEAKERYEEKLLELTKKGSTKDSINGIKKDLEALTNKVNEIVEQPVSVDVSALEAKIDTMSCGQNECAEKLVVMNSKINEIEQRVNGSVENEMRKEAERLTTVVKMAPTIHSIIQTGMKDMDADHIFVALLHNGTQTFTGIPFMRMDVIAEKFDILKYPHDVEWAPRYKDEDLTMHNKLPAAIIQNPYVDITVEENGVNPMEQLDMIVYKNMLETGAQRIMFQAIRDSRGIATGFLCAYSFNRNMDLEEFRRTADTLERIYRDINEH